GEREFRDAHDAHGKSAEERYVGAELRPDGRAGGAVLSQEDPRQPLTAPHEHRASGSVDDLGRDRAEKHRRDPATPAVPDYDEIGRETFGLRDDDVGRPANWNGHLHGAIGRTKRSGERLELGIELGLRIAAQIQDRYRGERGNPERLDRVDDANGRIDR